ncbi:MAG: PA0069 family radical SAM protein [Alphaproteobacteria bacterium]|nr:PA0069 family radical SAM protein [Alphaproteobacteria bacterium]
MNEPGQRLSRKGRGALTNATNRFERHVHVAEDDGWGSLDDDLPPLRTTVQADTTRTIIARNQSPDIPFDRSINPYRGCEHGCVYCFARPTHAYLGLSPGQDFESRLFAKPNAAALLRAELARPGYRCRVMAMGTNTDPYQPIERTWQVTRQVLKVLAETEHPVGIVTKSALIQRDIDILAPMAGRGLAKAFVSVTTLDRELARRMEPRVAAPERRLETIQALAAAGIPTGVMFAPAIPGLNDHEMERVLEAAAQAGATMAGTVLIRLPLEIKDLFREWLETHVPDRAKRVITLIRECHEGKDYVAEFRRRQVGTGPIAQMLNQRFRLAAKRYGLDGDAATLDTTRFRPPRADTAQLSLL